ncbi:MAG: alpha/beta fold hydrolase [Methyloligellaceae bacterium]
MIDPIALPEAGLIDTAEGPTFVRALGSGPPVFVLHGGPAWDHTYLVDGLAFLAERRTLIFYDQPGCGRTPCPEAPTAAGTFRHFRNLASRVAGGKTAGVVAHSWGALVFIAALSGRGDGGPLPDFAEGVLINPAPLTSAAIDAARRHLMKPVPLSRQLKLYAMFLLNFDASLIMAELKPYYSGGRFANRDLATPINIGTYKRLLSGLTSIDLTDLPPELDRLSLLVGGFDYAGTRFVGEMAARVSQVITVEEAGHFPFHEAPEAFREAVAKIFP